MNADNENGQRAERVDGTPRNYANVFFLETSMMDFNFRFGLRNKEQAENNAYELISEIFMSPAHAKSMWQILGKNIANYEKQFGELPDYFALENGQGEAAPTSEV